MAQNYPANAGASAVILIVDGGAVHIGCGTDADWSFTESARGTPCRYSAWRS